MQTEQIRVSPDIPVTDGDRSVRLREIGQDRELVFTGANGGQTVVRLPPMRPAQERAQ